MMVVGLHSGKELLVQDKSFFITVGEQRILRQVFVSPDGKRRYTVDESRIEFYDEVYSQEYMDTIHKTIEKTKTAQDNQKEGVSYG